MAKFLSDEYFAALQTALGSDQKWSEATKSVRTSLAFNVTDINQNYLVNVENGTTTLQKVSPGAPAEFSFDGTYDAWVKVAKGEVDLQSAILRGQLRFRGSLTKILMYRERLMRVADIMKQVPAEY